MPQRVYDLVTQILQNVYCSYMKTKNQSGQDFAHAAAAELLGHEFLTILYDSSH